MGTAKTTRMIAVFFWAIASVCAGPVIGAEEPASPAASDGTAPVALFEENSDDVELPQGQSVNVGSFGEIDLHVKDLDLTKVLQLLSIQSQRNIIASRNVAGSVSADLYDVDFYDALDAILTTNGFGYQEKGNFIYVYTTDELVALEEAQREVVTEVVHLDYLTATDASAFVSPLLSNAGSISLSGEVSTGFQPSLSDAGADSFANEATLVIRDYPENVEQILAVLEELDVRPKQVLVEAMILSAELDEDNEFGVDFSVVWDFNMTDFISPPLGVVDDLIDGDVLAGVGNTAGNGAGGVQSNVGNTGQSGGFKVGVVGDDFSVFVRALDQVTDTTVLAMPKLLVLNRQRADLLVGERLGYLSSTSTDTSTTQTVEFLDVGTQLTVRPFISSDDFIRLEMRPSVSEGSTSVEADTIIPNENTSEMVSNVMVKSGQTVVLGGFFKEQDKKTRRQVPGLGDVPLAGYAFRGQEDDIKRDEVIFMVKPTIMKDEVLVAMGDDALHGAQLAVVGARDGLLPWGHHRLASAAVRNAHERIREGETDKALWHVNIALGLEPTNVEARRIKEQLTGEKYYLYTDSILDEMIDSESAEIAAPELELGASDFGAEPGEGAFDEFGTTETYDENIPAEWSEISDAAQWFETEEATDDESVEVVPAGEFIEDEQSFDAQDEPVEAEDRQSWSEPAEQSSFDADAAGSSAEPSQFEWFDTVEAESAEADATDETFDPAAFGWFEAEEAGNNADPQPMSIFDFVNQELAEQEAEQTSDSVTEVTE